MNYTKNYQLNQWDAADRVLREDFNEDNRKIEEALAAIKTQSSLTLLHRFTLEKSSTEVEFPLSIDWDAWKAVHLQCEAFTAEDRTEVYVELGGKTIIRAWGNVAGDGASPYLGYAILLPLYDARRQFFYCHTNGYTGISWVVGDGTFAALSPRLNLSAYRRANVHAGTTITLWGER